MKLKNILKFVSGLLAVGVLQSFNLFADDNSARRYAALDNRDTTTSEYFLLGTKQVQRDLKLTRQQIKLLESAGQPSTFTNDPVIAEFRRSHKQLLAAAQSDEERHKINREGNAKFSLLVRQYDETVLQKTLSPAQTNRLNALFLQMTGPIAILKDTNLIQVLNLSDDQVSRLKDITNSHSQFLTLLRQRFGQSQIQTERKKTIEDASLELESLARVIKEIEKDQDEELLAVLTDEQAHSWNALCGKPVSINWEMDNIFSSPFPEWKTNN